MSTRTAEQLKKPHLRGPMTVTLSGQGLTHGFAGRATLASGDATVVVSTALVGSGDVILFNAYDPTGAALTSAAALEVKTVNPGVQFTIGSTAEVAPAPHRETIVMWLLLKASA